MPKSSNRDNEYIQNSLFGEEPTEGSVDDKLRERQIRGGVEIYSEGPVPPQFPPLIILPTDGKG